MSMTATPPAGLAPLLNRRNWVGWRPEERDGKLTKIPYQVERDDKGRDQKAKAGEPSTWDTFRAVADACTAGRFAGPGYEFHAGEGFFGIDLDGVRDPQTGKLTPLAAAVVALADTYTEPSPSGRGVHIIGRGELPRPEIPEDRQGKKQGPYELYAGGRFFTMTLAPFPGYDEVRDVDAATMRRLFALMWPEDAAASRQQQAPPPPPATPAIPDDAALLEHAFGAKGGEELRRRHGGENLLGDPSADDWAYLSALAFWAQRDPVRVRRLAEGSGRVREKWATRRGGRTWLEYSIAKACREQPNSYDPTRRAAFTIGGAPTDAAPLSTVDTPPDPCGEKDAIIADLRAKLAERDRRLRAIHELLTCEGMTPIERVIAYGVANEAGSAQSRKGDDEELIVNQKAIAENVKVSRQSVGGALKRWSEYGHLKKDSRPTGQRTKTGEPISETILRLPARDTTDNYIMATTWTRPEGTPHVGGNGRRCPKCATTKVLETIETAVIETRKVVCAECGHIHEQHRRQRGPSRTEVRHRDLAEVAEVAGEATPLSTVDTPPCRETDTNDGVDEPCVNSVAPPPLRTGPAPPAPFTGVQPCYRCDTETWMVEGKPALCTSCERLARSPLPLPLPPARGAPATAAAAGD